MWCRNKRLIKKVWSSENIEGEINLTFSLFLKLNCFQSITSFAADSAAAAAAAAAAASDVFHALWYPFSSFFPYNTISSTSLAPHVLTVKNRHRQSGSVGTREGKGRKEKRENLTLGFYICFITNFSKIKQIKSSKR